MPADPHDAQAPPPLTDQYYRARKLSALTSGLLLVWVLVGVDLSLLGDATDSSTVWIKSLKSPEAIPLVLLVVVLYSLYRLTNEWYQCNIERRRYTASKIDFWLSISIGLIAIATFVIQLKSEDPLGAAIAAWVGENIIGLLLIAVLGPLTLTRYAEGEHTYSGRWNREKLYRGRQWVRNLILTSWILMVFLLIVDATVGIVATILLIITFSVIEVSYRTSLNSLAKKTKQKIEAKMESIATDPSDKPDSLVEVMNEMRRSDELAELEALAFMEKEGVQQIVIIPHRGRARVIGIPTHKRGK